MYSRGAFHVVTLLFIVAIAATTNRSGSLKALAATDRQERTSAESAGGGAADAAWVAKASHAAQEAEYHFSLHKDGRWSAPNRAHDLRTFITGQSIELVSRTQGSSALHLTLALASLSRPDRPEPIPPLAGEPLVESHEKEASVSHGDSESRLVNDASGIRHRLTIETRPEGDGPISFDMELGGNLQAFPDIAGRSILFKDSYGQPALNYAGLVATDVSGEELPARFVVEAGLLRVVVEDADALYPISVESLLSSPTWSAEGGQDNALFGHSVATAGDVNGDGFSDVIIGARTYDNGELNEGGVFVYLGSASGLAASPAWTAEGDQASALFGFTAATAGDINGDGFSDVVVGAPQYDNGQTDEGQAYVYMGSASGLAESPAWIVESEQAGAGLGYSAATAGDVNGDGFADIIVGASGYANGQANEGRAYVYLGSASGLIQSPAWIAEGGQPQATFGRSVSTAGDINGDGFADVIVGAPLYTNGESSEGAAFVYLGSPFGLAALPAWTVEGDQASAALGYSAATAGDINGDGFSDVIVGAFLYDNGQNDEGAAFVYLGSPSGLSASPAWTAESNHDAANLGISVATAGDVNGDGYADVIIGAYSFSNVLPTEGRADVYLGSSAGLTATPAWTAEESQDGTGFGQSVATAGDVNGDGLSDLIVGAFHYTNGQHSEGAAFVYFGAASGLAATQAWTAETDQWGSCFGCAVSTAGDVNGDGFSDVIIGAYLYDNGETDEGRAFVYLGSESGLGTSPAWMAEGDRAGATFGLSAQSAGDVNGDGFSDVIVGAPDLPSGTHLQGRAFVYFGSPSGLTTTPGWTGGIGVSRPYFGWAVSTAGDVNGDGFSDIIIGAWTGYGVALVYLGSADGPASTPAWTAQSDRSGSLFGYLVSSAGDVDGDGFSDVVVGAAHYSNGQTNEGRVYAYLGSASGLASSPAWIAESNRAGALFGSRIASAGDVNGDGFSDVIVGAERYENGQLDEGAAFLYLGGTAGLGASPAWTAEGDQQSALFGYSVAAAGDVNGDGFSDVIIGAPSQPSDGRAFVYLGSVSGLSSSPGWTAQSALDDSFGFRVSTAGDVNGDGFSDVTVGASQGPIRLYLGGGGDGLSCIPRQVRGDGNAPVAVLGKPESPDSFRLRLQGRTPAGRGFVRMEYEIVPLSSPFGTSTPYSTPLTNTGYPDSEGSLHEFDELVSRLPEVVYKWRVRLQSTDPLFPRSRWFALPDNAITETDLRLCAASISTWYEDFDDDGFGDQATRLRACTQPAGYIADGTDCDDADAGVYPGAPQICDGLNTDCLDPGWPAVPGAEVDDDGDAWTECAGDCDDAWTLTWPGAPEWNDGHDNQCPGYPGSGIADEIEGTPGFDNPADRNELSWTAQGGATLYQVLRATTGDFSAGCTSFLATSSSYVDPSLPPPGALFFYLVRAVAPFVGSWGWTSIGVERQPTCALDTDQDGVHDGTDNCVVDPNPGQQDSDFDGIGDACDWRLSSFALTSCGGAQNSAAAALPWSTLGIPGAGTSSGGAFRIRAGYGPAPAP